jgi:hypothetical protein
MFGVKLAQYKINVDPELKKLAENVFDGHATTTTEGTIRLLEWFIGQAGDFRTAILNRDAETQRLLARGMLERMATLPDRPPGEAPVKPEAVARDAMGDDERIDDIPDVEDVTPPKPSRRPPKRRG